MVGTEEVPLGVYAQVIAGQSPDGQFYNRDGNGLPFFQGKKDFGEWELQPPTNWTTQVTKEALPGDILMSVRAPVGPINFTREKVCIGRGLAAIRCRNGLDADYLFYQLLGMQDRIAGKEGAVFASINKAEIEALPIVAPPLPEQRRIVAILDEAFEGIAKAKASTERCLQNSTELFQELIERLFPEDSSIDSDSSPLDEFCELIVDCEHRTAPTQETGIPSIRTPNIGKGQLLLDGVHRVSDTTYLEWTRRAEPQGGDLILAREAPAGNVAVIPDEMKVCLGQRTVLIRPRKSILDSGYLAQLLLRRQSQKRLLSHSRGATVQHINMKDIRAFKLAAIPALPQQRLVTEKVNKLLELEVQLTATYQRKLSALDELRKSVLHRAFSGQL